MKGRLLTVGFASVLGIAVIVGLRADSSAGSPVFSNGVLNGSYAFNDQGTSNITVDSDAFDQAFSNVGVQNCNGSGRCAGSQTVTYRSLFTSDPGYVCTFTFKSIYTVNSNGTGTNIVQG